MSEVARPLSDDAGFFLKIAVAILATIFAAFSMHLAFGRSSFSVPLVYHLHAFIFMGWVVIFVVQHWLAARGAMTLHRPLGWLAVGWVGLMVFFGIAITVAVVQRGKTPFFFYPQHFLIANPLTLLAFVGLFTAAIVMRRRTDWHRRLHLCAMAMILGPAFGRLVPPPLMMPYAFGVSAMLGLIFPLIAILREWRAGAVHPVWKWALPILPLFLLLAALVHTATPVAQLYAWITDGTPGAAVDPLAYGPLPSGL